MLGGVTEDLWGDGDRNSPIAGRLPATEIHHLGRPLKRGVVWLPKPRSQARSRGGRRNRRRRLRGNHAHPSSPACGHNTAMLRRSGIQPRWTSRGPSGPLTSGAGGHFRGYRCAPQAFAPSSSHAEPMDACLGPLKDLMDRNRRRAGRAQHGQEPAFVLCSDSLPPPRPRVACPSRRACRLRCASHL